MEDTDDRILAAMALRDLFNGYTHAVAEDSGVQEIVPSDEEGDASMDEDAGVPLSQLTQLPDTSDLWPLTPGKGWFAKNRQGSEIHFLERIFLMLSFGNLRLRKTPSRTMSDTIRYGVPLVATAAGKARGAQADLGVAPEVLVCGGMPGILIRRTPRRLRCWEL